MASRISVALWRGSKMLASVPSKSGVPALGSLGQHSTRSTKNTVHQLTTTSSLQSLSQDSQLPLQPCSASLNCSNSKSVLRPHHLLQQRYRTTIAVGQASAPLLDSGTPEELPTAERGRAAPKAALLIIGNEILTGKIQDTNTATLAKVLFSRGVDLIRVEIVPDVEDDIVESIHGLWKRVGGQDQGFVFTSGGIGPTHDDITYAAIAMACETDLSLHQPTLDKMRKHYESQGKVLNESRLRMATLPTGCEVLWTPNLWVPLAVVKNVYVLPGIPRLFTAMIDAAKERFTGALFSQRVFYTKQGEGDLAEALSQVAKDFQGVAIGSYPATEVTAAYTTKLTFESRDDSLLLAAVAAAEKTISFMDHEKEPLTSECL